MSPTLTTFLFEAANFLILAGVLGWLLFKPVRNALERRQAEQARQAEEAARKVADAEELDRQSRQRHRKLDEELERIRAQMLQAAEQQADEIREAGRADAQRQHQAIQRRLSSFEHQQLQRLANAVAAAARSSTSRLLEQIGGPDLDQALVAAACRQIGALEGESLGAVRVESASPLSPALQKTIAAAIDQRATSTEFRTAPEIGSGVRIRTSCGVIDASANGFAQYAQRVLADELAPNNNSHSAGQAGSPAAEPASLADSSTTHTEHSGGEGAHEGGIEHG